MTTGMCPGEFVRMLEQYRAERAQALEVLIKVGADDEYVI